jgi:hypothetical protein
MSSLTPADKKRILEKERRLIDVIVKIICIPDSYDKMPSDREVRAKKREMRNNPNNVFGIIFKLPLHVREEAIDHVACLAAACMDAAQQDTYEANVRLGFAYLEMTTYVQRMAQTYN